MKSKLLLSLGLVAILGMAQTVEAASDIDVARFILARLSPEQRTALFAEYAPQETAVPVVQEESYTQPEWIEEQFGKGYRGEDVYNLGFYSSDGSISTVMNRVGKDGSTRAYDLRYRDFRGMKQTRDLVRAVIHGFAANAKRIYLDFNSLDDYLSEVVIDHINKSGFSNLETLSLNVSDLTPAKKARLEQALLNSRSSNLKRLDVHGGSFKFAKAMAETKVGNPALSTVRISEELPADLNIVSDDMTDMVTHDNGVVIESSYEYDKIFGGH